MASEFNNQRSNLHFKVIAEKYNLNGTFMNSKQQNPHRMPLNTDCVWMYYQYSWEVPDEYYQSSMIQHKSITVYVVAEKQKLWLKRLKSWQKIKWAAIHKEIHCISLLKYKTASQLVSCDASLWLRPQESECWVLDFWSHKKSHLSFSLF